MMLLLPKDGLTKQMTNVMYWQLTADHLVHVDAPTSILQLFAESVVLTENISKCFDKTTRFQWNAERFNQILQTYWKLEYGEKDNVYSRTENGFFLLGKDFFIEYTSDSQLATFYIEEEVAKEYLIYSYPFLKLVVFLLNQDGYSPLHASVIGNETGFVLMPGKQFSGKSTTTATWVLHGGMFVGDDICFIHPEQVTRVYGHYPSFRLRESSLKLFEKTADLSVLKQKNDSKYFYPLLQENPRLFIPSATLKAIFCIQLHEDKPTSSVSTKSVGFNYLASSFAFAIQHDADNSLCIQTIKKLVTTLPIYEVFLSPNMEENYQFLDHLIRSIE